MTLVVLTCRECQCVFEIVDPSLDLIEYAICPSCRFAGNDEEEEENS